MSLLRTTCLALLLTAAAPVGAPDSAPTSQAAAAPESAPTSQAASAPAATAQPPFDEPSPLGEASLDERSAMEKPFTVMLRVVLVLAGIILLAYLVLHKGLGSLTGRLNKGRLLRVVDRIGLEPKKTLYVVEVVGRYYLIGTTDHGVSCLATLSPDGQSPESFEELLRGKPRTAPPASGRDEPAASEPTPAPGGDHG
ncbi:MAG: flagellar biosynthetic protein FliO [Deltaproteobacteria bacterium]|nr:flagellar biosynthetic protein FliO [Deltaproteobacteria bacterium]